MTLEQLQKELVNAMKAKNKVKKEVIAEIMTFAKNIATRKVNGEVTETIVAEAILKAKEDCATQIEKCPESRQDLMEAYKLRMSYIEEYMPKMMAEKEIKSFVEDTIAALSINNPNPVINKGAIMKEIMPKLKGKADGKLINEIVDKMFKNK